MYTAIQDSRNCGIHTEKSINSITAQVHWPVICEIYSAIVIFSSTKTGKINIANNI